VAVLDKVGDGFANAFLMAWQTWWALVLGFSFSAIVQARVSRERIEATLGGSGPGPVGRATVLGAASSSCSYAAIAIARSLFAKGASAVTALTFQLASTNLVWELGLVLWILIGWQFTLAEYLGGMIMIALMALLLRVFVSRSLEAEARRHAQAAPGEHDHNHGHQHGHGGSQAERPRWSSLEAWSEIAGYFRADWAMLYREITIGFLLSGFIGLLSNGFFEALFIRHAPAALRLLENAVVGPVVAVLSFVCSIGNVPLAAVLWSGGISFAGVLAFLFADLIVLPIILIYRKYYGSRFALRITALMLVTMIPTALILDGLFSLAGLIPHARPSRSSVFGEVTVNYKLWLNLLGLAIFGSLFALGRVGVR
jgi:uncharacterized membrane protein YraQ (UPF0718 family)